MTKLNCKYCNKEFELSNKQEVEYIRCLKNNTKKNFFCSKSCAACFNNKFRKTKADSKVRDEFGRFVPDAKTTVIGKCAQCGKNFELKPAQLERYKKNLNVFCSKSCSAKYSNAHRTSEWLEHREDTYEYKYGDRKYVNKEAISTSVKLLYENKDDYGFFSKSYNQIMLSKYNTINIANSEWLKQHNLDKYGTEYYFQSDDYKNKMSEKYNSIEDYHSKVSKLNKKFVEMLKDNNINCSVEKYVSGFYYDIEFNGILIEINPTVTHNTITSIFNHKPIKCDYHYLKSKNAWDNNFRCIHIFDWDDKEKIINILCNKTKIYARNCKIVELSNEDITQFLNKYHLQNTCQGQVIRLGLYYKNELVQVMTFGKPRYNKNYEWELLRLCSKFEYKVIGGSEKLFSYFIKTYKPKSIISYCDLSKFTGEVYERLGFKHKNNTKPAKHWSRDDRQITDNLLRQRGYDQLFRANYGKGTLNEQLMLENGWLPVYDCGQGVFIWNNGELR